MEVAESLSWQSRSLLPNSWRTSTGATATQIAHSWREEDVWEGENMQLTTSLPLPPTLRGTDLSTGQGYLTTTRMHHSYQPQGTILDHPRYKRAPASYKVHYNEEFTRKLAERRWRRPLDISYQSSEYADRYRGDLPRPLVNSEHGQELCPPRLGDHHQNGPLKDLVPTQKNSSLQGWSVPTQDQGVFWGNEPYMSKATHTHRSYSRHEQKQLPRPNQASFWQCEQFPKAWGYGSQEAVMSKYVTQPSRGLDVRDNVVFPTRTQFIRPTHQLPPVRSGGGESLVQASYQWPSKAERQDLFFCPVNHQAPQSFTSSGPLMPAAPEMYQTGNMEYGR